MEGTTAKLIVHSCVPQMVPFPEMGSPYSDFGVSEIVCRNLFLDVRTSGCDEGCRLHITRLKLQMFFLILHEGTLLFFFYLRRFAC